MSNEVAFNSLEKDDVKITFEEPSRIPSKPTEDEVAQHRKTRLVLVVLFGVIVLTMVVVAVIIIILSPRCEPKKVPEDSGKSTDTLRSNDTLKADDSWWKHALIYQVYPRSFFDTNKDGDGDLKGITEKLDHFVDLEVDALWLNPIYDSPMADNGYDVKNYLTINKMFGTMEDFDKFLSEAHKKGMKVIMDFVPNHTSEQHPWFLESKKDKSNPKSKWYIWADGKGENKTDPPSNWISFFGGSAWEYDDTRKQFYLHQFKKEQPDLNLKNEDVKKELKKVLEFWIKKGVDGFRVDAVQFFLEDDVKFPDEPQLPNYNSSDLKYDMLNHTFTNDLEGDHGILEEFQDVVNNGSKRLLIADVQGDYEKTMSYYNEADIPKNFGLISKINRQGMTLAQGIKNTVEEYVKAVPNGKTPNWVIGNHDTVRVGSRLGEDNRNAMNVLLLTLPGVVTSYYGEEIGMLNGNVPKPSDFRDDERTPMQWSDDANAGFTTGKPWLPVASQYKTLNVKTEKADAKSFYSMYKKLVMLRKVPAFASGDLKIVHSDEHVFSYTRSQGSDKYVVTINFGDKRWDGDINGLSGRGITVFDSEKDMPSKDPVDVNKIVLNPGQAVIVNGTNQEWHFS